MPRPAEGERMREMSFAVGIDIGGTFTKIAILGGPPQLPAGTGGAAGHEAEPQIFAEGRVSTEAAAGPMPLVARAAAAAVELARGAGLDLAQARAAGVGIAGLVEQPAGVLAACPNLTGWEGLEVAAAFSAALHGLPVLVENDANAFALAEARMGAGRGADPVVLITLGTGVGGGIVAGGRIVHGAHGFAGEFGHMALAVDGGPRCACGRRGCVEAYLRSSHVVALALEMTANLPPGPRSPLARALAAGEATARAVGEAAQAGDPVATAVFTELGRYLGIAMANVISALNPEVVVVGGGVALAGEVLLQAAREVALERVMPPLARGVRVLPAALGDRGGMLGAALLALDGVPERVAG
jgi:glucokinase